MTSLAISFKLTLTLLVILCMCCMAAEIVWKSSSALMPNWFVVLLASTFILFVFGVAATFLLLIWTI